MNLSYFPQRLLRGVSRSKPLLNYRQNRAGNLPSRRQSWESRGSASRGNKRGDLQVLQLKDLEISVTQTSITNSCETEGALRLEEA